MNVAPASPALTRQARAVAGVYLLAGLDAFALWVTQKHRTTSSELVFNSINVPVRHSLVSVAILLLLAFALARRKRVGLVIVAAFQVAGMYFSVADLLGRDAAPVPLSWKQGTAYNYTEDVLALVLGAGILVWLWGIRRAFPARLPRGSWARALGVLVVGLMVTVVVTWGMLTLRVPSTAVARARDVGNAIRAALGDVDAGPRLTGVPEWLSDFTALMVIGTLMLALFVFLRSARPAPDWTGARELHIRELLRDWGEHDSLGYLATRRDKNAAFAPNGQAVVMYRVVNGVCLASGDPVGDPRHWPAAVTTWMDRARSSGWTPAVISASEDGARAYVAAGLEVIHLGDEAILYPDQFTLGTQAMSPVRRAAKRAARAGLVVEQRRQGDIEPGELQEIVTAAEAWRGDEPDRGFSMALNRDGDAADSRTLFVTARDAEGQLLGVLSFVPWGRSGVSLDVMRRSPDAPNGVTELMVTELMAKAQTTGVRRVSLNFCVFRTVYADRARLGVSGVKRLNYRVLGSLDRFFQLERLYVSNQKYDPEWKPRYVCYDGLPSMLQVAVACGVAEGFVPSPFQPAVDDRHLTERELEAVRALAQGPDSSGVEPRRADQTRQRIAHLSRLAQAERELYPAGVAAPDGTIAELLDGSLVGATDEVRIAGRVRAKRDHGGVVFAEMVDGTGQVQLVLERDLLTEEERHFAALVDTGDLVMVRGRLGDSRNGTRSLLVHAWGVLAKALHPVPFDGIADPETRARQRSMELLVDGEQSAHLRNRSRVVAACRGLLEEAGFLEVETPILQAVHGGATARPFQTRSNAYGMDLVLRIAPELYLKRLVVAGMGPVFEIGRNFRNEGADATHNPEFTSLEAYQPYGDYHSMRVLTERIVKVAATAVHGAALLPLPDGGGGRTLTDVSGPWAVCSVLDAVSRAVGCQVSTKTDLDFLLALARDHDVAVRGEMGAGAVIEELYGELVEPHTVMPTFFVDFPQETSPLTRAHRTEPGLVERWDLVVGGFELATAYTELNDPLDQRRRLTEQSLKAAAGDLEAMELDEDFLFALETGMPPCGGMGMGIDRLAMLIGGTGIRSVLSFPFVKPRRSQ